ncbi:MAG: DUF5686 family protein [Bacteroidota bacterium]
MKAFIVFFLSLLLMSACYSQLTTVRGIVRDATTNKPLQNATVSFPAGRGSVSDVMGRYLLETQRNFTQIIVSYVGYKKDTITIEKGVEQEVNIELFADSSNSLDNVVVRKNKHKGYSNKNNPAVELIKKVIENKWSNRSDSYDFSEFEQYDKLEFSLSNPSKAVTKSKLLKKYSFITQNRDTTKLEGKSLLPVYLEETISQKFYRKNPAVEKTKILATRKVNFGPFVDNNGITSYLNFIYQDIDIYESNINLLTSQFLSPISDLAPTFYMFTIQDTIVTDEGDKLVKLYFTPRNTNDILFRGTLFITTDGNYAVQQVNMSISKNININWVRNLKISQEFEKNTDGRWHVSKSNLKTEFGISNNKNAGGIFAERLASYRNFTINQPRPDSIYSDPVAPVITDALAQTDSFWTASRHDTLSEAEAKIYYNMDSLRKMRSFQRMMDIATLFLAGYKSFPGFEIGPVSTFYSFNPIEGFRLRFGGRSTTKLSSRFFVNTYVAYGFKDEKWKYYFGLGYSLNKKSIYEFPNNFVRGSYQQEVKIPGQELQFVSEDNFLLSFKRGENDKYLYNKIAKLEYIKEFRNHFSYNLGFKNWQQSPAGALSFLKFENGVATNVEALTTTELSVELRYAPNEKFYQNKNYRTPLFNKYPIFTFRYIQGIKGIFKGDYNYSNVGLNIFKKIYLGQFGYTHAVLDAGYIFGQVPYPLLTVHRANQTYAYQLQSYNLMNFLEFVSDHYVSLNLDHNFQGLILNRIPLIKRLKWREVASFKILQGGVRNENDPALHPELYKRPVDSTGNPITYSLNRQPYMEASVGVANIFKFLRIDLVKRITYLDHPNVSALGIRARLKFDF